MGKRSSQSLPLEVNQLKLQIQGWRQTKKSVTAPMPGEMWDLAIRLAKSHGVSRIAQATGLDYGWLRKKVEGSEAKSSVATPTFLELPRAMAVAEARDQDSKQDSKRGFEAGYLLTPGSMIDLSTPDGARMRIRLEAGRELDAAGLVTAFFGRAR
jgi:hypothetical protein